MPVMPVMANQWTDPSPVVPADPKAVGFIAIVMSDMFLEAA
ncbi:hypothetical protein GETHOR_02740 [Geothrix oryzae]|uniref:Uncharacterized protein n=1 Tax=Geothrix oryzae TaxID=2927975 RepID=A0ABM8DMP2_9BACT|nr:hypothetical protein GETHOR_02740 [Geothrix oryzae]